MIFYVILKDLVENFLVQFFFFSLYRNPKDSDSDPDPYGHFLDPGSGSV